MSMQKPGFPNISIKLYEDYTAWSENRFVELGATFTTLTLRDGLYGRNEGILQFYDTKNLHKRLDGNQVIQISLSNANSKEVINRMYGCKNMAVSVDSKGDNILAINLAPIHIVENLKFSRAFFPNASESIEAMLDAIYSDRPEFKPKINGTNAVVPRMAWVNNLESYMDYVREVGMSVETDTHVFVWEDNTGVNIIDYKALTEQEPQQILFGEIKQIGDYVQNLNVDLGYDFAWLTKSNQHVRNPMENVTIYSHSFNDKEIQKIIIGDGENSVAVSRSGGYSEMTYRNGYEEAFRLATMAQYDAYATCKMIGNFKMTPGLKLAFNDTVKNQFVTDFYIDEVVHTITSNSSETQLYMFTNSKDIVPIELEKVKNEIQNLPPPSVDMSGEEPEDTPGSTEPSGPIGDRKNAKFDLDALVSIALAKKASKSLGKCALYVRQALQASQFKPIQFSGGLGNANQMGSSLVRYGWVPLGQNIKSFKKGDIAIFQKTNTTLGAIHGHVCIYTGNSQGQWVSDFLQPTVQPSRGANLTYTLYRCRYGYSRGN